jgi:hypothetical protein
MKSRGGIAIYIADNLNYIERPDLCVNVEGQFECMSVEIKSCAGKKNLIVSEIYRVPNTSEIHSIAQYEEVMTNICNTKCDVIVGTDQNIDYMKVHINQNASNLLEMFITLGSLPVIRRPTRITHNIATLIDNIYVKSDTYENIDSRVITCDISDHFPVLACLGKRNKSTGKQPLIFSQRKCDAVNMHALSTALHNTQWDRIFHQGSQVNECYEHFISYINEMLDKYIPVKTIVIPHHAIIKEAWMTPGLCKSARKRDTLYKKSIGKGRDSASYARYLVYRNKYHTIKRCAKKSYYAHLLRRYDNDIRKTWKLINTIIGRSHDRSGISDSFIVNGKLETDKDIISNGFCTYFTNIGKQFAEAIPRSRNIPEYYLGSNRNRKSIFMTPTDPSEIRKLLLTFKPKKSTGDDGISMKLLKQICEPCSIPLAMLVNLSLEQGIVPDAMKLAKVIPIYKAKSKESLSNYRPISLLSNISKLLEKVVHRRLYSFLEKCNILNDKQYGFRPARSTIDAITEFTSDLLPALDNKQKCLGVYLDLSKAFDTINHQILLKKLDYYGIRGKALEWFKSYLNQRRQYVCYKDVHSSVQNVEYGVPQGSVLGPLLFILYSNDIPNSLQHSKAILFADDTTVYHMGNDLRTLYDQVNFDLANLNDWFRANLHVVHK